MYAIGKIITVMLCSICIMHAADTMQFSVNTREHFEEQCADAITSDLSPEPKPSVTTVSEFGPSHVHEHCVTNVRPDCTNGGYNAYLCRCGDKYTAEETEALGHNWLSWHVTKKSTWFKGGKESRTCARCNKTESRDTAKRTIPNSGTIKVERSENLLDYLIEPKPEDFGKYYDNAVLLYNAFLNRQEDWCYLFFAEDTYELERQEWEKLKATFEEKCFQSCGVSIHVDSYTTGAFAEGVGLTRINIKVRDTQELFTKCCNAIRAMGLYTGMSQYDAVFTINEWMRNNIVYEHQRWNPLVVLRSGRANCAGYAQLFERLCKLIGVNATYVTGCAGHTDGSCQDACHAWNRVQLAGVWYYIDICWNDSKQPNCYFLTEELWSGRVVMSDSHTA